MKNKLVISLLISVLCYFSVTGQNNSNSTLKDGLQRINVSTIQGTITVNLPAEIHSGDQISGTVSAIPSETGTNKKDKKRAKKNKEALEKYTVSFHQNSRRVSSRSLDILLSPKTSSDTQELTIYDEKGKVIAKIPVQINDAKRTNKVSNMQFPTYVRAGNTCYIKGNFDGNMKNSKVMLGENVLPIIAESPDRLICEIPNTVSGLQKITVTENGITNSATCNVVGMNLSVGKLNLLKGESTNLVIEVYGLENIETPVEILVENKTQENINLSGGNTQNITIFPNQASAEGTYNKTIQVQSKRAGNYTIDVTLIESFRNLEEYTLDTPETTENQNSEVLTNNIRIPDNLITYTPQTFSGYNFSPYTISAAILPNVFFSFNVMIDDDEKRKLRNKGRKLPANAPLGPTDPDDKKNPHSRPVPTGIKGPNHEEVPGVWDTGKDLLEEANKEVKRAKAHKGKMTATMPAGPEQIGKMNPHKVIRNNQRGCTEEIYIFYEHYRYIDDRTLVLEEQLSPSHEFFIAKGETKVDITKNESGWSVKPSVSADVKGLSIGIEGSYWKTTSHTTEEGSLNLKGRHLWLFHIGRLYLYRKAFVRIKYEYHYEVCTDGSTRNWVVPTYTDNWHFWYEWEEEIFVTSRDDEGSFHKVDGFPETIHNRNIGGGESNSYPIDGLESKYFDNYGQKGWDFFPAISKK
ncbi:hypothetical protein IMCC3317_22810 [Kordia antarctica]|uniref:IPT/TIG domain-containing protein n=1 Tax=Kordia antarctica TaxID=1218801 RepID=A0A7L4ZK73_9FLAO|nr:IPT/TIG domain-containing protein [Kordia antarctica]QHI36911.1 hypothetical protein IMCC3317_22810 [Kordia antarctica]